MYTVPSTGISKVSSQHLNACVDLKFQFELYTVPTHLVLVPLAEVVHQNMVCHHDHRGYGELSLAAKTEHEDMYVH